MFLIKAQAMYHVNINCIRRESPPYNLSVQKEGELPFHIYVTSRHTTIFLTLSIDSQ